MHISSQLGKVVTLWLPRAKDADVVRASAQTKAFAPEATGRRLKVLLMDDNSLVSMNTANRDFARK